MSKHKSTKKRVAKDAAKDRNHTNALAMRETVNALSKVKSPADRDRILDAVQCLLGAR